jgi:hypothetical protein
MTLAEVLRAKSSEYELLAEWHGERAPLDEDHSVACQAMLAVGSHCGKSPRSWTWSGGRRQMRTETRRRPDRGAMTAPLVLAQFSTRLPPELLERLRAAAPQRRG